MKKVEYFDYFDSKLVLIFVQNDKGSCKIKNVLQIKV